MPKENDNNTTDGLHIKTDNSPVKGAYNVIVARNGIYVSRETQWFDAVTKSNKPLNELAHQTIHANIRYPQITGAQLELIVGFFAAIADRDGSEAGVLYLWDTKKQRTCLSVPHQKSNSGFLEYDLEQTNLARDRYEVLGDIHSHVHMAPFSSSTDMSDEEYGAGLHIVMGKIKNDPPECHVEFVTEGTRFQVKASEVMDWKNYKKRIDPPVEWVKRVVHIAPPHPQSFLYPNNHSNITGGNYEQYNPNTNTWEPDTWES